MPPVTAGKTTALTPAWSVHTSTIERSAALGLALLLVVSAAFAIVAAQLTTSALSALADANAMNDWYVEARYAVAAEESLERKYRLEPAPAVRAGHAAAGAALEAALAHAIAGSETPDRKQDNTIIRAHHDYIAATQLMFSAVDAHRPQLALRLDRERIDPVFGFVQEHVSAAAARQRALTARILARTNAVQRVVVAITLLLSMLSVVCFGAYIAVLGIYKRRACAVHRSEVEHYAKAALVDNLTGIGNHRAFKEAFHAALSHASQSGQTVALALLDIDEMKLVNDRDGHLHGDRVLQTLGTAFQRLGAAHRPFRLGGDEFGVVLTNTTRDEALVEMERLRAFAEGALFGTTISVGIATAHGDGEGETLHAQADAALYAAKRAGRNMCVAYDPAIDETSLIASQKIRRLRSLIAGEGVSVVFQPIWDVARCTILAYEALARPAAEFGFDGPQEMFDLAERVGRAHEIDAVCRRATLARACELPDDVLLFMNVTPQSLNYGRLDPRRFGDEVIAAGLSPQRVVIEITERSMIRLDVVIAVAKELQAAGFRLALDDTGAGNAGLQMLSSLAVEYVKIDRGIIVKAMTDRGARGVMAGIVAIAKETGAYVIAEGIEDIEMLDLVCGHDWDRLHQRSVRGVQGYLLRRPSATLVGPGDSDDAKSILQEVVLRQRPPMHDPATLAVSRSGEERHP